MVDCPEWASLARLIIPESRIVHNISQHLLKDEFAVHATKGNESGDDMRMLQAGTFRTRERQRNDQIPEDIR